ncbi:MAG: hypothetical protein B1H04_01985 [Planctomycetales bacterium 4484_123]|nr:MAG: hypothetical protein B1H04_01985 [Planctomycetales bacterium 4484_123]
MPLLVGAYRATIDAKNRLAIPAALRQQINPDVDGRHFYLVLTRTWHLVLFPDQYYRRLLEQRQMQQRQVDPFLADETEDSKLWFRLAQLVKPDSQGRFVIPTESKERAVLAEDVTLLGSGDHIAIWPTKEWEEHVRKKLARGPGSPAQGGPGAPGAPGGLDRTPAPGEQHMNDGKRRRGTDVSGSAGEEYRQSGPGMKGLANVRHPATGKRFGSGEWMPPRDAYGPAAPWR